VCKQYVCKKKINFSHHVYTYFAHVKNGGTIDTGRPTRPGAVSTRTHSTTHRNEPTENRLRVFTRIRMAIFFDTMLGNTRGRSISSEAVLRHGQTGPAESKHVILHPYRERKKHTSAKMKTTQASASCASHRVLITCAIVTYCAGPNTK
jgi:hypothetical protein